MCYDDKFISHLLKGLLTKLLSEKVKEDAMVLMVFDFFLKNPEELNYKEWDVFLRACWFYMKENVEKLEKPKYRRVLLHGLSTSVDMAICQRCKGNDIYVDNFMRYAALFLHLWHKILKKHEQHISEQEMNDYKMCCNKLVKRTKYSPSEAIYNFCGFGGVDVLDDHHICLNPKKDILVAVMNQITFNEDDVEARDDNPLEHMYGWFKEKAEDDIDVVTNKMRSDVKECIEYLYECGFGSETPVEDVLEDIGTFGLDTYV